MLLLARLEHARLVRANVNAAQFAGARLERADFTDAMGLESAYFDPAARELLHGKANAADDTPSLEVQFSVTLRPEQIEGTLLALADFYRACGGLGLPLVETFRDEHTEWSHETV
jgi:hypothetical protein